MACAVMASRRTSEQAGINSASATAEAAWEGGRKRKKFSCSVRSSPLFGGGGGRLDVRCGGGGGPKVPNHALGGKKVFSEVGNRLGQTRKHPFLLLLLLPFPPLFVFLWRGRKNKASLCRHIPSSSVPVFTRRSGAHRTCWPCSSNPTTVCALQSAYLSAVVFRTRWRAATEGAGAEGEERGAGRTWPAAWALEGE